MKRQLKLRNGFTVKAFGTNDAIAIGAKVTDGMLVDALVYLRETEFGPELVLNEDILSKIGGRLVVERFNEEEEIPRADLRLAGVMFEHGKDDFGFWEGFALSDAEENIVYQILVKHDTEGCSVRGTKKEILEDMLS